MANTDADKPSGSTNDPTTSTDETCNEVGCKYFLQKHPPGKGHVFNCTDTRCKKFNTHHVGESPHVY